MSSLVKYVFIQNDPFYLPKVLDKYLREFADSTAGVNIQSVAQGKRTVVQTAMDLCRLYGPGYFAWKFRRYASAKIKAKFVNDMLGSTRTCHSVKAVARKYSVSVTEAVDVNSEQFLAELRRLGVQLIVSISGTQLYRKPLREQTSHGIVNCHGALLPRYRGLMPSFWTLDNGPIVVQRRYRIHAHDSLEEIMARSKDLAAEAIIDAVRLIESGDPPMLPNDASQATHFSMPAREDVRRFLANGHRFR
ncbi:MAG: formyltransferase family protein [Phycisphaerales bacterium]